MLIDGAFEAFTLEDKDRDLEQSEREDVIREKKVYAQTAIPLGTYNVDVDITSLRGVGERNAEAGGKELPLVFEVKGFSGIRIHVGNTAEGSEGCVLVGTTRSDDFVGNSRAAFSTLFDKIEQAIDNDENIILRITQDITQDERIEGSVAGQSNPDPFTDRQTRRGTTATNASEDPSGDEEGPNFQELFNEINTNLKNIEASDVNVTWGKRLSNVERSDWISLKQFLLYLCTRYAPQSVFPFVELIPVLSVDNSLVADSELAREILQYERDGKIPKDSQLELLVEGKDKEEVKTLKERLARIARSLVDPTELPPGFETERFNLTAKRTSALSGNTDLFLLDPFKEGYESLEVLSEGGEAIKQKRGVGVRVYGQLVFTPEPVPGFPSKPGAIGFTSLEVKAGTQSTNGLARIKMELLDVQGNKFTDINSPWAFIYDVRPGSEGGDFYFRYGWELRLPDPSIDAEKKDETARNFWNHPGWKIFDTNIKQEIRNRLLTGENKILLTQAAASAIQRGSGSIVERIFDNSTTFDKETQTVQVKKSVLKGKDSSYVRLSITNPEIDIDPVTGATTAMLEFFTAGAIAKMVPLVASFKTKALMSVDGIFTLAQLITAVEIDSNLYGVLPTDNPAQRRKLAELRAATAQESVARLLSDSDLSALVSVVGADTGGNRGEIDPGEVLIDVPKRLKNEIKSASKDDNKTLVRWFRQVLQENECELLSVATGSGAGINAAYVITTTQDIGKNRERLNRREGDATNTSRAARLSTVFSEEQDVFAFRFQGSLAEQIKIAKTDAPNAMKIAVDFNVSNLATFEAESSKNNTKGAPHGVPTSAADRKRNLLTIFSQMQNCNITAIAHPWLAPGKKFFIKGMGFYDGIYMCLSVTHSLSGHKFTSNIEGARILLTGDEEQRQDSFERAASNGRRNKSSPVAEQTTSEPPENQGREPDENKTKIGNEKKNLSRNNIVNPNGELTQQGRQTLREKGFSDIR